MSDLNAGIEAGLALEREGKEQEAIEYFRQLVEHYPHGARLLDRYARAIRYYTDELEQLLD